MLCVTVCLAGSEQALHVKNVLEEPQEHGLSEGRWYAVDADEALLEGHSVHTLAGVFGCSLQDLHVLQRAFESNGLVSRGTPQRSTLSKGSSRTRAQKQDRMF